jgi:hypothetical protein
MGVSVLAVGAGRVLRMYQLRPSIRAADKENYVRSVSVAGRSGRAAVANSTNSSSFIYALVTSLIHAIAGGFAVYSFETVWC